MNTHKPFVASKFQSTPIKSLGKSPIKSDRSSTSLTPPTKSPDRIKQNRAAIYSIERENKLRDSNTDRIFQIITIYMRLLMGQQLTESESHILERYNKDGINFKFSTKKPTLNDLPNLSIEALDDFYLCETDLYLGDMVITFPNPDYKQDENTHDHISFKDALKDFEASVGMQYNQQSQQDELDYLLMKMAFVNCYSQLSDYINDKQVINQDQEIQEAFHSEQHKKKDKNNELQQIYEQFEFVIKQELKKQNAQFNRKIPQKNISPTRLNSQNTPSANRRLNSENTPSGHRQKRSGFRLINKQNLYEFPENLGWLTVFMKNQKSYFLNRDNKKVDEQIHNNMNYDETNDYLTMQNNLMKKKKKQCGDFLNEVDKDGNLIIEAKDYKKSVQNGEDGKDQSHWKKSEVDTKDFYTLMRNLILIRLSQTGFFIRNFLSVNGSKIYSVLYYSENNMKALAEKTKMIKFLNIEFTDLLSLEPCDSRFRPLRQNNRLYRTKDYDATQITDYFLYLRPKIIKLINEIQFKKMAREVNVQSLNEQIFSHGTEDILQDEEFVSDETWAAYYEYLMYVQIKVSQSRAQFVFNNDDALLINEQKQAKELYILRNKKDFPQISEEKTLSPHKDNKKKLQLHLDSVDDNMTKSNLFKKQQQIFKQKEIDFQSLLVSQKQKVIDNIELNSEQEIQLQDQLRRVDVIKNEFKTLREIQHLKPHKYIGTKHLKERMRELLAYEYGLIMREAIRIANVSRPGCLKTMWDIQQIEQFETSSEYFVPPNNLSYKRRCKINTIWKKYEVTESQRISIFSTMERLKLVYDAILQTININYLIESQQMEQIYALNDQYELYGKSQKKLFRHLFQIFDQDKFMQKTQVIHFSQNLKIIIDQPENFREQNHEFEHKINSSKLSQQLLTPGMILLDSKVNLQANFYQATEAHFVQPKLKNLDQIWRFRIHEPWFVPSDAVRNYYGEKIALYFAYLGHYTKSLFYIGILSLVIGVLQYFSTSEDQDSMLGILFGFVNVQWINVMINEWYRNEKHFAAKFGQSSKRSDQKEAQQRPSFNGLFQRSVVNDNLNTQYYPFYKTIIKMLLNLMVLILISIIYQICVVGLFILAVHLDKNKYFTNVSRMRVVFEVALPALINVILILFFDEFYDRLSEQLTQYENHQTISDFESNFILKKFCLSLFSYIGPLFQISYLSDVFGLDCAYNDCYLHSRYYFATIFVSLFMLNIWEIVKPTIMLFIQHGKCHPVETQDIDILNPLDSNKSNPLSNFDLFTNKNIQQDNNPFQRINDYIEAESQKSSYVISSDRYGTVDDYMEISIQLALLGLYGTLYPISYMIGLVWNIIEMQTDKKKLIKYMQRPVPIDESSIGIWYDILDFVANICIIQNAGIIFILGQRMSDPFFRSVAFFLIVLFINFIGKFIQISLIDEIPQRLKTLIERQGYLVKSTLEAFKIKRSRQQKKSGFEDRELIFYPLYKVYGCILEEKKQAQRKFNKADSYENLSDEEDQDQNEADDEIAEEPLQQRIEQIYEEQNIKPNQTKLAIAQYEFKFLKPKDLGQDKTKLTEFYKKTKLKYKELMDFQTQVEKSSSYQTKWTDQRILSRSLYMRRSRVLLCNLDYRRIKIYKDRSVAIAKMLYQIDWQLHERKFNKQLDTEETNEKSKLIKELTAKSTQRSKRKVRRVVVLRINGIWFHQFRKSTKSQRATTTMAQQFVISQKQVQIQKRRIEQQKYGIEQKSGNEELFSAISLIKNRKRVFDYVETLDILKIPIFDILSKLGQPQEDTITNNCSEKHVYVKMIDQFSTLQIKKMDDAQRMKYNYDFPRSLKLSFSTNEVKKFCLINDQTNYLRSNDAKSFKLIKMIDNSPNTNFQQIKKIFFDRRSQKTIWVVEIENKTNDGIKSINQQNQKQYQMMEFLEVDQSCLFSLNNIQRTHNILRIIENSSTSELQILKYNLYSVNLFFIQESSFVDQYFDPFSKGYVATIYKSEENNNSIGMTLKDTILIRKNLNLFYQEKELILFLDWLVKIQLQLNISFNSCHGNIHPSNFVLVSQSSSQQQKQQNKYKIFGFQSLFKEVQSNRIHFSRQLQIHNMEFIFVSPELMNKYINSLQIQTEDHDDFVIDFIKSDVYSCGMLLLHMMTLGTSSDQIAQLIEKKIKDCPKNKIGRLFQERVDEFIIDNEVTLINQYPAIYPIIKDMLNPQSTRKNISQIFNQISSDQNLLNSLNINADFYENELLSPYIEVEVKRKKNNLINMSQHSLDKLKLYQSNQTQDNKNEVRKSQQILSKQIQKLTTLFKLKLLDQLELELQLTMKILHITFKSDNNELDCIFQHILSNSNLYCEQVENQRLLLDFLNIYRIHSLFNISSKSTLKDIHQKLFLPDFQQINQFLISLLYIIDKTKTKKQINLVTNKKSKISISDELKNIITTLQNDFDFIEAYSYLLALQYDKAQPLLIHSNMNRKFSNNNQVLFIQKQMIFRLWIFMNIDDTKQYNQCLTQSEANICEIEQILHDYQIIENLHIVRKLQNTLLECRYIHVQLLIRKYQFSEATSLWQEQMTQMKKLDRVNLCIFEQTNYIRYQILLAEQYWGLNDGVNFDLCVKEFIDIFSKWINSINKSSITLHQSDADNPIIDQAQIAIFQVRIFQDFFIFQLAILHQSLDLILFSSNSETLIIDVIDYCHKLEYWNQVENRQLNYLALSTLIKSYQIINVHQGNILLREQSQHDSVLQNKTSVELFLYYQNLLTQNLIDNLNLQDKQSQCFVDSLMNETFTNFLFSDPFYSKSKKSQIIQYLSIPLIQEKIDTQLDLNETINEMDQKYIFGKLMFKLNKTETALNYFYSIFSEGKKLKNQLEKQKFYDVLINSHLIMKIVIVLHWSFKSCMKLQELEVAAKLIRNASDMLDYSLPWWQYFLKVIAVDLSIHEMNPSSQLICRLAIKILSEIQLFEIKDSDHHKQQISSRLNSDQAHEFSIMNTSFLLQEYTNTNNLYILSSFQKKQFILIRLNQDLQEMKTNMLKKVRDQQSKLNQMVLNNLQEDKIKVFQVKLNKDLLKFDSLIQVQSSLLEECGDPVSALKFIEEDYKSYFTQEGYKKVQQPDSNDSTTVYESALKKFKISGYQMTLNLFEKCIPQLHKIAQYCQIAAQTLVDQVKNQINGESFQDDNDKSYTDINPLWRPQSLFYITKGIDKQIQEFTQYKILFYATKLKLLEALCMKGNFKQALSVYKEINLYYSSFLRQYKLQRINEKSQQTINNYFIQGLFEYSIGIYYFYTEQFQEACQYFESAHKHYQLFNSNSYPKVEKIKSKKKVESMVWRDSLTPGLILRGVLDNDMIVMKKNNRVFYEMHDEISDPILELKILKKLFHFISCQLYCRIYECRAVLGVAKTNSSQLIATYDVIVETLEYSMKIMGRDSIVYADVLLVYTGYLNYFRYTHQEDLLKLIFKTRYFNKERNDNKSLLSRPGLKFQEYNIYTSSEDKFIFRNQDDIQQKFNYKLLGYWIYTLSQELIEFYSYHYGQVLVISHLNLVECHLILNKLYFQDKKLFFSQNSIQIAQKMLFDIIPDQNHPLFIHLYYSLGNMNENTKEITDENIEFTLKLNELSRENKLFIVKELLCQNKILSKDFDEYKANPFDHYLVQKLQKFIEQITKQPIKNYISAPLTKIQMQEILDTAREQVVKEVNGKSNKDLPLKQQSIQFYRKAFMICNRIYNERNPFFNQVEESYLIQASEEDIQEL